MCPPGTWFLNGRTTATEMVGKRWSPVTEFSQEADGIIIIRQEGTVISFTENEFFFLRQNRKPLSWHEPLNRIFLCRLSFLFE